MWKRRLTGARIIIFRLHINALILCLTTFSYWEIPQKSGRNNAILVFSKVKNGAGAKLVAAGNGFSKGV